MTQPPKFHGRPVVSKPSDDSRPSRVVGRQVKRLRDRQGISAQRLADRCAELGHPEVNRSVIADIESRRERVSIDEVMVLAAALNTPATLLIAPLGNNEKVAVTAKTVIHPHLLLDWLMGEEPLCNTDLTPRMHPWPDEGTPDWQKASLPIWLFRQLRRYQDAATEASHAGGDHFDVALRSLFQHLQTMERSGLEVPAMPPEWIARWDQRLEGVPQWAREIMESDATGVYDPVDTYRELTEDELQPKGDS